MGPGEAADGKAGQGTGKRVTLRLGVAGDEATAQDASLLLLWLREDPELEDLDFQAAEGEGMGPGQDLLVSLATSAIQAGVFRLLRAAYNYLRNSRGRSLSVTVDVTDSLRIELTSTGEATRAELERRAEEVARYLRDEPE